jgi:hypothetical protein
LILPNCRPFKGKAFSRKVALCHRQSLAPVSTASRPEA